MNKHGEQKAIYVIDRRDWKVLDCYPTARALGEVYGFRQSTIAKKCRNKMFNAGEYTCFRYADDWKLKDEPIPSSRQPVPVNVYDRKTERVYRFPDVDTAAKHCHFTNETVRKALKDGGWHSGFMFRKMPVAR